MFISVNSRAASAYKRIAVETSVQSADPHTLVGMLFDALLQSISLASGAIARGDTEVKGKAIGKAVRIIEEGLKAGLNARDGGEIAQNLRQLYDYSVVRLTRANVHNDAEAIKEVARLIEPLAQSWAQIKGSRPTYLQPVPSAGA